MIDQFFKNSTSLTYRVIKGGAWMMALRLVMRGSTIIVSLILARLLAPEDFGLVAIGILSVSLLKIFTETGFNQALIKETHHISDRMLNTAWSIEISRGIVVPLMVFILAPLIADFFNSVESVPVIRVLGLIPFIHGLTSIKIIFLQKELEFHKQFFYELSAILGPFLVAIPLAFILKSVWAIVFGTLASHLFQVVTSYILMPYIPKFEINYSDFRRMFVFGKWIFIGSIVSYFAMELDTYIVAKIFDAKMLGIYVLAFSITNKPIVEITKGLSKVLFPAFVKIGNNQKRLKQAFFKSTSLIYAAILPLSVGMHLVAEDFVRVALDNKWFEMIPVMSILALAAMLRGLSIPSSGFFFGIGQPKVVFLMNFGRMVILMLSLLFIMKFTFPTLQSVALAVLIANFAVFSMIVYFSICQTSISIRDWVSSLSPLIISIIIMLMGVSGLHEIQAPGFFRLVSSIFLGAFLYFCSLTVCWKFFKRGLFVRD